MCSGAKYIESSGKEWKVYFPNPKAALTVAKSDGSVEWVKWGRRKEEQAPFVQGGWPRPIKLNLDNYLFLMYSCFIWRIES